MKTQDQKNLELFEQIIEEEENFGLLEKKLKRRRRYLLGGTSIFIGLLLSFGIVMLFRSDPATCCFFVSLIGGFWMFNAYRVLRHGEEYDLTRFLIRRSER